MVFPMIWMFLGSVKTGKEAMDPTMFFPDIIHLENVIDVVMYSPLMKYVSNSLIVAIVTTFIQLVTGAMLAYAFVFLKFKGRKLLFALVMATYMLPSCATYIPAFVTLAKFNLLNTRTGLIVSQCVSIFGIFLLRTSFMQIPNGLIEAAKLDGANDWNILWRIVFPVTKSSFITFGLMSFISLYNNYMWPSLITKDPDQYLVAQGLRSFFIDDGAFGTDWAKVLAGSTVIVIPLLILFAFTQKWFINGLSGDNGIKE
jgi:multiple sugar transport system permease protein